MRRVQNKNIRSGIIFFTTVISWLFYGSVQEVWALTAVEEAALQAMQGSVGGASGYVCPSDGPGKLECEMSHLAEQDAKVGGSVGLCYCSPNENQPLSNYQVSYSSCVKLCDMVRAPGGIDTSLGIGANPGTSVNIPEGGCEKLNVVEPGPDGRGGRHTLKCGNEIMAMADCWCINGGKSVFSNPLQSLDTCKRSCKQNGGQVDTSQGIGLFQQQASNFASAAVQRQEFINNLCFTPEECAGPDYKGVFVPNSQCPSGKGRCNAPEPEVKLNVPLGSVDKIVGLRGYVDALFRYALSIVAIVAAVMFVYGGFKYIFGSSFGEISSAKEKMVDSAIGLVIVLCSIVILNTVNPATTNLKALEVFQIKKELFSRQEFCKDFQPEGTKGEKIKFAESGDPPGSSTYSDAKFVLEVKDTMCGKKYYPENFGGKLCSGSICEPGSACINCKTKDPACEGITNGYVCKKAIIQGTISWADKAYPENVYLLGICNGIQVPGDKFNWDVVDEEGKKFVHEIGVDVSGETGQTSFTIADKTLLQKMKDACNGHGGFRGMVLGVQYNDEADARSLTNIYTVVQDTWKGATAGAKAGVAAGGPALPFQITTVPVGIITGAIGANIRQDDFAIIIKENCDKPGTIYAGYANGESMTDDDDLDTAIYCGYWFDPPQKFSTGDDTFHAKDTTYWKDDELEKAFAGEETISCNFHLGNLNTPPNPAFVFESRGIKDGELDYCKKSWCPSEHPNCN